MVHYDCKTIKESSIRIDERIKNYPRYIYRLFFSLRENRRIDVEIYINKIYEYFFMSEYLVTISR